MKIYKISANEYQGWILDNGEINFVDKMGHEGFIRNNPSKFNISQNDIESISKRGLLMWFAYENNCVKFSISKYESIVVGKQASIIKHIHELQKILNEESQSKVRVSIFQDGFQTKNFITVKDFYIYFGESF